MLLGGEAEVSEERAGDQRREGRQQNNMVWPSRESESLRNPQKVKHKGSQYFKLLWS